MWNEAQLAKPLKPVRYYSHSDDIKQSYQKGGGEGGISPTGN